MHDIYKDQYTPPDEIDLLAFLRRGLRFLRRYRWLFLGALLLGIAWGIYKYRNSPNIYRSRAVMHSNILTNQEYIQMADNWNALLKRNEKDALAALFNIPVTAVSALKEIDAFEIQKVFSPNNPNGFVIEVTVTDNALLSGIQEGMVYGYENSGFVKEKIVAKRARMTEMIGKMNIEIARLDSNKRILDNIIRGTGKASNQVIVGGANTNQQLVEMNEKLLAYKEELEFTRGIQVLQGFSVFRRPVGPNLLVLVIIGIVVATALAYIGAVLHSVIGRMKQPR